MPYGKGKVSGISSSFPELSQSSGQITHVLLTRSPLTFSESKLPEGFARLACVKHAASVRPEPGSNSPIRIEPFQVYIPVALLRWPCFVADLIRCLVFKEHSS